MTTSGSNNLWLFLEMLVRRRGLIIGLVLVITLGSVVVSLLLPQWFRASATLLPPKSASAPVSGFSTMGELLSLTGGLNLPVMATPSDLYARVIRSRAVTGKVIDRFNLMERYQASNYQETSEALMKHSEIRVTEEGLLMISVEDKDPQTAADLANGFIGELDNVIGEILSQRIEQTRSFIEDRLDQVRQEMDSARQALQDFQMTYKAVDFDEQTRLAVDQAIELKTKLAEIELDLQLQEINLGKDNAELVFKRRERDAIQGQLSDLENSNVDSSFFSLPVASIPELRGRYEVLYSRVRVTEALYQVLLEQREQTKVREYEKMPAVTVLDHARPPELKHRPQRGYIVLGSFGLSLVFSLFLAALLEYFRRLRERDPDGYNRVMIFLSAYFGWLPGVRKVR